MKKITVDEIKAVTGGLYNCICTNSQTGGSGVITTTDNGPACVQACCPKQSSSANRWTYFTPTYYASELCNG